jgi:hypothetical protein
VMERHTYVHRAHELLVRLGVDAEPRSDTRRSPS